MKGLAEIQAENDELVARAEAKRKASLRRLVGEKFGHLTVISVSEQPTSRGKRQLDCRCDCGAVCQREPYKLRNGVSVSCGCQVNKATHGHARHVGDGNSATYVSWRSMHQRCEVSTTAGYRYYGGRGITVCPRWSSFENFLADMGPRPAGMTLERKDSNRNYEPDNCRWATRSEQQRNTRQTKLTADIVREIRQRIAHGESQRAVAKSLGINEKTVNSVHRRIIWKDVD